MKDSFIQRGSTLFLRGAVLVLGLAVLAVCIFALPVGIASDQTGYYRPILIGLYMPAIPFYIALYQSLKLLNYINTNKAFSDLSVKALKYIKYCAIVISGMFALGMPYIFIAADRDDAPGVVLMGLVIIFASVVVAVFAAVLERLLRNAINIQQENELTV